jgi:NAD(P)-dependent dehydrogenase (short-subunit alcohol dehydrogenase family)
MTDKQTILITGASSGIGRAAMDLFHERGWNVVGTVRDPARTEGLAREGLSLVAMELTDRDSIYAGMAAALASFGGVDVLVNNAGFDIFSFFEEATDALLRELIETNLIGPIHAIRAILPHFRKKRSGTIINVTSLAALVGPPLHGYYAASKWGLEGLSESLAAELKPFGIRCRIVEPGRTATKLQGRWTDQETQRIADYDSIRERIFTALTPDLTTAYPAAAVAEVIWQAVTEEGARMRYPATPDAQAVFDQRDQLGSEAFVAAMGKRFPV